LKKVEVLKANEVNVKAFILRDFIQKKEPISAMRTVSKKEIKALAKEIGIEHTDEEIRFAKKIITAYLAQK
jgi:hypothetical protein